MNYVYYITILLHYQTLPNNRERKLARNQDIEQYLCMVLSHRGCEILFNCFCTGTASIRASEMFLCCIIEKSSFAKSKALSWPCLGNRQIGHWKMERIVSLIFLYKSKADKSNKAILPGCFTKTFHAAYTTCHKLLFAIMLRLLIWKQMNKLLDGVTEGFIGMQCTRLPYYVANTGWLLRSCPFTSNFTSLIHILIETLLKAGWVKRLK